MIKPIGKSILAVIYIVGVTLLIYTFFFQWSYDDPYITYRYAANLQNGQGFVYNPGEQVLSTTTPLFTLLLALLGTLWHDLPHLANVLGAFSLALGGFFLGDLAHTWKTPLVGWSGLLLYPTFPLLVSTLGSETPLYLAFCLGAFALYARQQYPLTAVYVALAILTRPDGVLLAFILAVHYFLRIRRPVPWMALALLLGLTIPWFIFAWVYFGSPVPATMVVKQHQGSMIISQGFFSGLLTIVKPHAKWSYLLHAGMVVAGLVLLFRRERLWVTFLAWTLLYFLAYSALGVSRYFWYYAPLVPGLIVLLGLGILSLNKSLTSYRSIPLNHIIVVALFLLLFPAQLNSLWQLRQTPDNRLVIYKVAGEWLREYTPPDASVGTLEVGMIGYYSQRKMVDFAGLIQPEVSDQLSTQSTYEDAAIWVLENYNPDYVVLHENSFPRLEQGYILQHCKSIQHFPGIEYGYTTNLYVYVCKR